MTVVEHTHRSGGRYGLTQAARMEWIKLRSLRSTWWTLAVTGAGTVAIGIAVGVDTVNRATDATSNALAGVVPGLLLAGVLGVLTMTSEYTSGMIKATFAAVPRRPRVLAVKALVFGGVMLAVGEGAAFISFFAGSATLRHGIPVPTLAQPGVLRAVLLSGASFCLIGLVGLGLGAIIRHSGAAIAALVGGVYVAATFIGNLSRAVGVYMPIMIVGNSLSTTQPLTCSGSTANCPHPLSAWTGLGMLCLYAAAVLMAAGWLLTRRDA
jgi:ABC-2 type transport system permease protein